MPAALSVVHVASELEADAELETSVCDVNSLSEVVEATRPAVVEFAEPGIEEEDLASASVAMRAEAVPVLMPVGSTEPLNVIPISAEPTVELLNWTGEPLLAVNDGCVADGKVEFA